MFEMESKFSVEWIFQECNLKKHCLHVSLKVPISIRGQETKDVYVLKVIVNDEDYAELLKNIAAGKNTNHASIVVTVFTDNIPVSEAENIGLSTANIDEIEKLQD